MADAEARSELGSESVSDRVAILIAFLWAIAEALFFFVSPDFYLFPAAVLRPKIWLRLTMACVAGTIIGSSLLYWWSETHLDAVLGLLTSISLVTMEKIAGSQLLLDTSGPAAFLLQPFSLIPLKVFTYIAAKDHLSLYLVLAMLAVGRILRNAFIACIAAVIGTKWGNGIRQRLWLLIWGYVLIAAALQILAMR